MVIGLLKYLDSIPPFALLLFALVSGKVWGRRDYVFWFVVVQTFLNAFAFVLDKFLNHDNLYIYHLNCAVSFFLLCGFFNSILNFSRTKLLIRGALLLFYVFFICNLLVWEHLNTFNSNSFGLSSLLLIIFSLLYYLQNLLHPVSSNIAKSADFWFVTGIFTYYTGAFFIFITFRTLSQGNNQIYGMLWLVHNVIFLVMCIYFLIGFLCKPSRRKYKL